jgi:hypothetical protein
MTRVAFVILHLAIAIAVALLLLGLWQWFLGGDLGAAFGEAARLLFLFMDIGLGVWLVLLIVGAVRGWGRNRIFFAAFAGVLLNLLTVIVVGFVQQGAAPWAFILFALTAGGAFLVGALVAARVVPRLVKTPGPAAARP